MFKSLRLDQGWEVAEEERPLRSLMRVHLDCQLRHRSDGESQPKVVHGDTFVTSHAIIQGDPMVQQDLGSMLFYDCSVLLQIPGDLSDVLEIDA